MNNRDNLTEIETPAFICDTDLLIKSLDFHKKLTDECNCKLLFPLKTFTVVEILKYIQRYVDGFSASSLFETKIARELLNKNQSVHITTPGLRKGEIKEISEYGDFIAFNSISQYEYLKNQLNKDVKIGFRINPQFSSNIDNRYNPCCKNSKLGVPIKDFIKYINQNNCNFVSGIHIHTNCDSTDFQFLADTFNILENNLFEFLYKIKWINLGGGYLFENNKQLSLFQNLIHKIKNKYNIEVYIEPGASIIRKPFFLVTTVLDIFNSDGKTIAILDTTVNHLPEVLEFNYKLNISDSTANGQYEYILGGSSCLAGDVFGSYKFIKPLQVGDKIIFDKVGAYSIVKANMFNGLNLPAIYQKCGNSFKLIKKYTYNDFIDKYSSCYNN